MTEDVSDAEVIGRSIDDSEMFGIIFTRHHDTIYGYAARRTGHDQAADLTAEVFARAFWLRGPDAASRQIARPWLYGIATNIIGDHIRSIRRRQRLYLTGVGAVWMADGPRAGSLCECFPDMLSK